MIEALVIERIKNLQAYKPHDYPYKYKLDANESPFNLPPQIKDQIIRYINSTELNRYPDTHSTELRQKISAYTKVPFHNIMVGNGSDEMIQLITNIFVEEGEVVLSHGPTFAMYKVATTIAGGQYVESLTDENFHVNIDNLINQANETKAKIIFLCTPNNPTGKIIKKQEILKVIENTKAIVVVDEAYIEFGGESVIEQIHSYERLMVLRTFSKAFGAASIRLGYLMANEKLISYLERAKQPYNINAITQCIGLTLLDNANLITERINEIKSERDKLVTQMNQLKGIAVCPTEANFIFFKAKNAKEVFEELLARGVMVRSFKNELENYLRVTVGTVEENTAFITALKDVV